MHICIIMCVMCICKYECIHCIHIDIARAPFYFVATCKRPCGSLLLNKMNENECRPLHPTIRAVECQPAVNMYTRVLKSGYSDFFLFVVLK